MTSSSATSLPGHASSLSRSDSILSRASVGPSFSSPVQSQVDGLVGGFAQQATDWRSLAAMMAGGMAYRAGRIGVMGLGNGSALRAASVGLGLTAEVSAFEFTHRGLSGFGGSTNGATPNLWRWNGNGGLRQGLLQSFVTFGALKGAGRLAQGENFIAQHLFQDTAMVLGHQVTGVLGIAPRPEGSLAEQFLHAEATNLQIGAGMALAGRMAPGVQALERGLDLSLSFSNPPASRNGLGENLAFAMARGPREGVEGESIGLRDLRKNPHILLSENNGEEGGGLVSETAAPKPEVASPGKLLDREKRLQAYLSEHPDLLEDFFQPVRDFSRLRDAIRSADEELREKGVNRSAFLNRVVQLLRRSEWEGGARYPTPFSVIHALKEMKQELLSYLSTQELPPDLTVAPGRLIHLNDPVWAIVRSYPLDSQGGWNWGIRVRDGAPRRALNSALHLVRDLAGYSLTDSERAVPREERLAQARKILRDACVRLVPVLGAGRHGLALGDWIRMAAGEGEEVDGDSIIPVMLGWRLDFVYELNTQGTYSQRLPDRTINTRGRLGLKSVHPRLNPAMLALADTIITTLESKNLDAAFTSELIRNLSPDATLIPAIKSVKENGESIPEWFLTRLAQEGRFDLMHRFMMQSGLGFPREMLGGNAPEAPVNLRLDSLSRASAQRAARLLAGDRSIRFVSEGNGEIYRAANRSIEVSDDFFIAAYWGFIKNFISPWVGYQFQDHLIQAGPRAKPQELTLALDLLVRQALTTAENTFFSVELPALRKGIQNILHAMEQAKARQDLPTVGLEEHEPVLRESLIAMATRSDAEIRQSLLSHTTGIEDLLGCTRIRDMTVYQRLVWNLLEAKGDTFERLFAEYPGQVKSQASSQNFAVLLLEPTVLYLLKKGMILRRPQWNFTVEGITGLPHAERRWGSQPPFVTDTLRWIRPDQLPRPEVEAHKSGMRHHALDVVRDRIKQMEDQLLLLRRSRARRRTELGPRDLMDGFRIGSTIVQYLREEMVNLPPRSPEDLRIALNDLESGMLRLQEETQSLPERFDVNLIKERIYPFLDEMQEILIHLRNNFDAQGDLTYWKQEQHKIRRSFVNATRKLAGTFDPQDSEVEE